MDCVKIILIFERPDSIILIKVLDLGDEWRMGNKVFKRGIFWRKKRFAYFCIIQIFMLCNVLLYPNMAVYGDENNEVNANQSIFINAEPDYHFNDVIEKQDAIHDVVGLGIMNGYNDGTFKPDNTVTKAEFAGILIKMLKLEEVAESNANIPFFSDVPIDHPSAGYINTLFKLGLISGDGAHRFQPEALVTYGQAIKLLVCALGYEPLAQVGGGYPFGYQTIAIEKGITKGIGKMADSENVTRGIIAQLIYNALDVELLKTGSPDGKQVYDTDSEETLMSDFLKVVKVTGVVTGTKDSGASVKEDEVEVDGLVYKVGNTNAKDYLGYDATFYYREDTAAHDNIIITVRGTTGRNSILTIQAEDIEDATLAVIEYMSDEKDDVQHARISDGARLFYNGKKQVNYEKSVLCPYTGNVKLIDTDDNGDYDTLFVNEYINLVVDSVSLNENIITDKYNSALNLCLDTSDSSYDFIIIKNNKTVGLQDLQEWDVISVLADKMKEVNGERIYDSANSTLYKLIVTNQTETGKITEITDDQVTINDKEYEYTKQYMAYNLSLPKVGDSVTVYLDVSGEIAGVDIEKQGDCKFGVLYKAVETAGVDKAIEVRIFTQDGVLQDYRLADKIEINDTSRAPATKELLQTNNFITITGDGKLNANQMLIAYVLNQDNEITKLYSASAPSSNKDQTLEVEDFTKRSSRKYHSEGKSFNNDFLIDSNTKVFIMPIPKSGYPMTENDFEMGLEVKNSSVFVSDNTYDVAGYNLSDTRVASVMVWYRGNNPNSSNDLKAAAVRNSLFLVESMNTAVNDEGDIVKALRGCDAGAKVTYYTDSEPNNLAQFASDKIKKGDLIQVGKNKKGQLWAVKNRFTLKQPTMLNETDMDNSIQTVYGFVKEIGKDTILIQKIDSNGLATDKLASFYINNKVFVYTFDASKQAAGIASFADIVKGEQNTAILIRFNNATAKEIVIYKNIDKANRN